jgi:hypothetical protein
VTERRDTMITDHTTHAWDRLSLFLSRDVLERRYLARHHRALSADKAKEIISHLEQARQYFASADSAGVLAGPLEQYYGVLSFSRAIVLYLNASLRETSLKKGHGLHASMPSDGGVEDIQLTAQSGTFDELLNATGNVDLGSFDESTTMMMPSIRRAARTLPRPPLGATFSLIELFARIPDLRQQFEEAILRPAHCHTGRVHLTMSSLTVVIWRDKFDLPPLETLRRSLGITESASMMVTPNNSAQFTAQIGEGDAVADFLPTMFASKGFEHRMVERFPDGWSLNELATYFAASHVLSMLVRYYPSRWASMVNHEKGDRLLPVFERMRALIQTEFVRLGIGAIESET